LGSKGGPLLRGQLRSRLGDRGRQTARSPPGVRRAQSSRASGSKTVEPQAGSASNTRVEDDVDAALKQSLDYRLTSRDSSSLRCVSSCACSVFSSGNVMRYSAASTLFGIPASAYLATAWSLDAQRITPTGGFSPSFIQCARA